MVYDKPSILPKRDKPVAISYSSLCDASIGGITIEDAIEFRDALTRAIEFTTTKRGL